jgi:hypothetical protein
MFKKKGKSKSNKQKNNGDSNSVRSFSLGTLSHCDDKSILEILSHLTPKELLNASLVSKLFWLFCNEGKGKNLMF